MEQILLPLLGVNWWGKSVKRELSAGVGETVKTEGPGHDCANRADTGRMTNRRQEVHHCLGRSQFVPRQEK